ncbi:MULTISPECIES: cytochrome c oxidase subunit II [Paenibacillus]|uniref:Cytochrome c oxidase subunit 2 n=1 Tax=Paenibacillus chondroitinus TaxID=59842 RepID=A0ABU6DIA5_9BACL|nr:MULTISPECIES: cytochrome c oxidase subunit II [Paenibacillus]MCY9657623.1 cytochrome c oxidase subunit II [Paenibacillus anseongense]MEB4797394.1 cytochrome c oxidase subunit II [Paenibacillus chondroitinus]
MSRLKKLWRLLPLLAVMTFLLTGCGDPTLSALQPKGPVASEQLFLMKLSLFIMVFVVIVVFAIYVYVLIRFRKRKGDNSIPKQVEGSHVLEIIWTVVPILLLLVLAVPTVSYTFKHSTNYNKDKAAVHVKVTAHQFWWQFEYPDLGIATAQQLVVPKDKIIAFELVSADVSHAFWVPSLGGKVDTNPGITNTLYLQADEIATFQGRCTELCGASHALMNFTVESKSQSDFDAWVAKMKAPVTVPATAQKGEELFKENCMSCHAVTANGPGVAPNLKGFADRDTLAGILEHTPEKMALWIHNPQDQKPGNKMPAFGKEAGGKLDDAQINDIVQYLQTLK